MNEEEGVRREHIRYRMVAVLVHNLNMQSIGSLILYWRG